jgi:hypothetical protein
MGTPSKKSWVFETESLIKSERNIEHFNGTVHFKKCKQLFEYVQHLLLFRDISGGKSYHLFLNFAPFFQHQC